jgi:hypothetical protein
MSELNFTHSNGNKVKLTTPDTLAANKTFKLPGSDGTSGQFLKTDGSGALSFATVDTDIADGSIAAAKLAAGVGGKVIQFVYKKDGVTTNSNSGGWTDSVETGHNVDITPIMSNSTLLVQCHSVGGNYSSGRSYFLRMRRKINNANDTTVGTFQIGDGSNGGMQSLAMTVVDPTPSGGWNTSHVVNYRMRFGQDGSGTARYDYTTNSILYVMEIQP